MTRFFLLLLAMLFISSEQTHSILEETPHFKSLTLAQEVDFKPLKPAFFPTNTDMRPEKVYVQMDKTMYQPGETVWFNVFIRDVLSHKASSISELVYVQLYGQNGNILKNLKLPVILGEAKGDIMLSPAWPGGSYKLRAFTKWQTQLANEGETYGFEKDIVIQKNILPNLRMTLDFQREAYGSGAMVKADLELKTLDDQPLRYHHFKYQISLDGKKVGTIEAKTNFEGKAVLNYQLPQNLSTNDGLLNVLLDYNGLAESISRSIPIVLNDIDVQFLPESGNLIANAENAIAFKAINEFGKPADISGTLYNENGKAIRGFTSYHQGMGKFKFSPEYGQNYTVKITAPKGIDKIYKLPNVVKANQNGIQIIGQNEEYLTIKIIGKYKRNLKLEAQANGYLHQSIKVEKSKINALKIPIKDIPMGIVTLILKSSNDKPLAERLVFVHSHKRLNINIKTSKKKYQPREKVKMNISVKTHDGQPVTGHFGLSVVDDKLLTFADDKQANIMAYMLLQSELKGEILEPNFYFEPKEKHPNKDQTLALDLLMMTQGWRKYDWSKYTQPIAAAAPKPEKRQISGRVLNDKDKPLKNAKVYIPNTKYETRTNRKGKFKFENILIDEHVLVYVEHEKHVNIITYDDYMHQDISFMNYESPDFSIVKRSKNMNATARITGVMIESQTGEPLIAASVFLEELKIGAATDLDGKFDIKNIEPGTYKLIANYVGFNSIQQTVTLSEGDHLNIKLTLNEGIHLEEVVVASLSRRNKLPRRKKTQKPKKKKQKPTQSDKKPKTKTIEKITVTKQEIPFEPPVLTNDNTATGKTITAADIKNLPSRSISGIVATTAGVSSADNVNLSIRGSRSNATIIYVDGIRVNGIYVPQTEANQLETFINGLPANYPNKGKIDANIDEQMNNVRVEISPTQAHYPTLEERFRKFKYRVNREKYINELFFINDELVPQQIAWEVLQYIYPKDVKKFSELSARKKKKRIHPRFQHYTVLEVVTTNDYMSSDDNYKNLLKKKVESSRNDYEAAVKKHNELVRKYERIAYGTEIAKRNITKELEAVRKSNQKVQRLLRENRERYKFLKIKHPRNLYLESIRYTMTYNYALNFKEGLYKAREFYVPKYESLEAQMVETRTDFRSTIYWNPNVKLNEFGEANVEFYTNDDITTFKAIVEGMSKGGKIGRNEATFYNKLPFSLFSKMPLTAIRGDLIKIPLTLVNNTSTALSGKMTFNIPKSLKVNGELPSNIELKANEKKTIFIPCKVIEANDVGQFIAQFEAKYCKDAFEQTLKTFDRGFPVSTVLMPPSDSSQPMRINIRNPAKNSLQGKITFYPSPSSNIIETTKRMIRQPSGCFEQVSSSNYPNILAYQYLESIGQLNDATQLKIKQLLADGLRRLTAYEISGGGFDWYGRGPAHEGLTAYGLMQFVEMSKIISVSTDLIQRTSEWLLSRKDGKGSFTFSKNHYRWGEKQAISTAYILWAIARAGDGDKVKPEIERLLQSNSKDPYVLALLANTLAILKDNRSQKVVTDLLALQEKNGSWIGAKTSMTNSSGKNLKIETTALAVLALIENAKLQRTSVNIAAHSAIKFIKNNKSRYGFGSTQSTVLAMQALKEFALLTFQKLTTDGRFAILVNGQKMMEGDYQANNSNAIIIDGFGRYLKDGKNDIKVEFSGKKGLNYDVFIKYHSLTPASTPCAVNITTSLPNQKIKLGETVRLTTNIKNTQNESIPNTLAIVGIPAGLSLQPWQLKTLQEKMAFDYYEIFDGYIIFHFLSLDAHEEKTIQLDLKADISGTFTAAASSAYLYYDNDKVDWKDGLKVEILE